MILRDLISLLASGITVQLRFDDANLPEVYVETAKSGDSEIFSGDTLKSTVKSISIDECGILVLDLVFCGSPSLDAAEAGKDAVAGYQDGQSSDGSGQDWAFYRGRCMSCKFYGGDYTCSFHKDKKTDGSAIACSNYAPFGEREKHD